MTVDPVKIPLWIHRADRRRRLLALGVSLDDQRKYPTRELDELLAVDATYAEAQHDASQKQAAAAESSAKFGGGR